MLCKVYLVQFLQTGGRLETGRYFREDGFVWGTALYHFEHLCTMAMFTRMFWVAFDDDCSWYILWWWRALLFHCNHIDFFLCKIKKNAQKEGKINILKYITRTSRKICQSQYQFNQLQYNTYQFLFKILCLSSSNYSRITCTCLGLFNSIAAVLRNTYLALACIEFGNHCSVTLRARPTLHCYYSIPTKGFGEKVGEFTIFKEPGSKQCCDII